MSERPETPAREELDRALRGIRFAPRASLGPEVLGRVRRGERSKGAVAPRRIRSTLPALLAGAAVVLSAVLTHHRAPPPAPLPPAPTPPPVTVDRCCYDLDGGGRPDDGIRLIAERNAQVHRLLVYEDRDDSRGYTPADTVRLERGAIPTLGEDGVGRLVTTRHCCSDFDGGGADDDGLLVLGVPPDRVVMAAIYERPQAAGSHVADAILR